MNIEHIMLDLKEKQNPSRKKSLIKAGASENTYGVLLGYLRAYAKKIGINQALALDLWQTNNTDARLLSVMLMDVKALDLETTLRFIESITFDQLLDDFMFRVVRYVDFKDGLFKKLIQSTDDMLLRAAWAIKVIVFTYDKNITDEMIEDVLKVIEESLVLSPPNSQWMMNRLFAQIGIRFEHYRKKVIELAEKLGVYKDMVVSPGCTSAYVPEWIRAVVK